MIRKLLEVGRRTEVQGSQLAFSSQKTIFNNHFLASIRTFHGSILGSHFFPNPVFLVVSSAFSDESSRFQSIFKHCDGTSQVWRGVFRAALCSQAVTWGQELGSASIGFQITMDTVILGDIMGICIYIYIILYIYSIYIYRYTVYI